MALDEGDPKFAYKPAESDHPDIGVRFGRENNADSLAGRGLNPRQTLATARRRKTTIPLSGLPELEPTHRLVDLKVPFGTIAIPLSTTPSELKLTTLTNGNGGLAFPSSISYYRTMLAQRLAVKIEPIARTGLCTETRTLAGKTNPSKDLFTEIPW